MPPPALPRPRRDARPTDAFFRVTPLHGRRAFLVRVGVWAALGAGPAALLVAVACPAPVPVKPAAVARPAPAQAAVDGAGGGGAAGFAETVLGVWLEAGSATESSAEMAQLRLVAPGVRAPRWGRRPVAALQVTVVRTERRGTGAWAVTVAVRLADTAAAVPGEQSVRGLRFFTLPVTETDRGDARAYAAGAPREAAGPQAGREPASPYTARVQDAALTGTVEGFLSAFLGADGTVERYGSVRLGVNSAYLVLAALVALAVGSELAIAHPTEHGSATLALLLFGGPMLYLATTAWFFGTTTGGAWKERLLACLALAAAGVAAVWLPPLASLALLDLFLITTALTLTHTHRRLTSSLMTATTD